MPLICFTVGTCWLINALVNDIANDMIAFNERKEREVQMKARKHLYEIIKSFTDAKQLSVFHILLQIVFRNFLLLKIY